MLNKRVRAESECVILEEQCGSIQGRGCKDQVFALCEKYLANGNDVFCAFIDGEKGYASIDRHGMWQILRAYGVR